MRTNKTDLIFRSWVEDVCEFSAASTIHFLQDACETKGGKDTEKAIRLSLARFLSHYVRSALLIVLYKDATPEATLEAFKSLKGDMQNAIAEGFEAAVAEFSNNHLDYYCLIEPFPESINKEPC